MDGAAAVMKVLAILATLAAAVFVVASPANAQTTCHVSDKFLIAAQDEKDFVGTAFAVYPRGPGPAPRTCRFDRKSAAMVIEDNALWFQALNGKHLVLTSSTGPSADLLIYDLAQKKQVFISEGAEDIADTPQGVTFWAWVAEGTRKTCPQFAKYAADGLGAQIVEKTVFDFATGKARKAGGAKRCLPTQ